MPLNQIEWSTPLAPVMLGPDLGDTRDAGLVILVLGVVFGILGALLHRQRTGEGQYVEIPQVEAAMHWIGEYILETGRTGEVFRAEQQSAGAGPGVVGVIVQLGGQPNSGRPKRAPR